MSPPTWRTGAMTLAIGVALIAACDSAGDVDPGPAQPYPPAPPPTTTAPPATGGAPGEGNPPPVYHLPQIDPAHAVNAYVAWRDRFLEDCGGGLWRVASHGNETVSEAIGYGMLLTAIYDDQIAFDGLWRFYSYPAIAEAGTGLMHWRVSVCPPAVAQTGPASDAELDVAMSANTLPVTRQLAIR